MGDIINWPNIVKLMFCTCNFVPECDNFFVEGQIFHN